MSDHAPTRYTDVVGSEAVVAEFPGGSVVQLMGGSPTDPDAIVADLVGATVVVTTERVVAVDGVEEWSWQLDDLEEVRHSGDGPWTLLPVPGVPDCGVAVAASDVSRFRSALSEARDVGGGARSASDATPAAPAIVPEPVIDLVTLEDLKGGDAEPQEPADPYRHRAPGDDGDGSDEPSIDVESAPMAAETGVVQVVGGDAQVGASHWSSPPPADEDVVDRSGHPVATPRRAGVLGRFRRRRLNADGSVRHAIEAQPLVGLEARAISAWFGTHHVLDRISLDMPPGQVTALIGPSGCGKSTFIRILNRMHEMIPSASLSGEVLLDGEDIYDPQKKLTEARRQIGMVFQKPNPFPAMSIYDNVVASFQLTGLKVGQDEKDETVETCLRKAGLWTEVRDRLRQPGGGLSGGQQQRLCIARALAIKPRVLLMDEPCSALDPTSTRRIEQTIMELASEVTIVIVTHNMQQAARVSHQCAFFLAEQGTPGIIVEHGPTTAMFESPQDPRTYDYVNGRFG